MKKIVWLTEWFPSRVDPLSGDGIERHAKAASVYNDIYIIHVKKNPSLRFPKTEIEERTYNENCRVFIYYYPTIRKYSRILDMLLSNFYFLKLHWKALRRMRRSFGNPAGLQVNITMKAGIIALLAKRILGLKYIVLERWSLFLPESKPRFEDKSLVFRSLAKKVLGNANMILTVSNHLGQAMKRYAPAIPKRVLPNVVDKTIFHLDEKPENRTTFRFIHVSTLDHPKNVDQIILAFSEVLSRGYSAELVIHAPPRDFLRHLVVSHNLQSNVILKEEVAQQQLAESMHSADALVLFSLYETFGNVVIEAQACGLPVITSDYPTFRETVVDRQNGIIAPGKDAATLARAMIECIQIYPRFNRQKISADATSQYSFDRVGKLFDEVYNEAF